MQLKAVPYFRGTAFILQNHDYKIILFVNTTAPHQSYIPDQYALRKNKHRV